MPLGVSILWKTSFRRHHLIHRVCRALCHLMAMWHHVASVQKRLPQKLVTAQRCLQCPACCKLTLAFFGIYLAVVSSHHKFTALNSLKLHYLCPVLFGRCALEDYTAQMSICLLGHTAQPALNRQQYLTFSGRTGCEGCTHATHCNAFEI